MNRIDLILISQSEIVNYAEYSKFPIDRISLYRNLIYPRMLYYQNGFRSHLDVLNKLHLGLFWEEASYAQRRNLFSIWNLPGFNGIHIANYLRQFGIHTCVINNFDAEWDRFCDAYENTDDKPLVGISTTFHLNYSEINRITVRIKKAFPDAPIVLGGAFVNGQTRTTDPEAIAKSMKKNDIGFIAVGFNSEVDLRNLLLSRREQEPNPESIQNLIISKKSNNERGVTATASTWHDPVLEDVPLQWQDLDLPFLNQTIQMRTSSGCYFSCAFCSYPKLAHGFHAVPVELFENQLRNALSLNRINKIIFIDDTFNVPVSRFRALCSIFAKYDFEWFSFIRVQYVTEDVARLMKESGCRAVYLGIESANDQVLQNMNKKATCAEYIKGIEHLKKQGIATIAAFVLGFPGETGESIYDNVRFIEEVGFDFYTLKEFYYMDNTPIYYSRDRYGLQGKGNQWAHKTMDSEAAYDYKISIFKQIKNSVFIDPDTSMWYVAYLYDQGFSINDIKYIQGNINELMVEQLNHRFDDNHPAYGRISDRIEKQTIQK
jgi:anaerobic magnesium-protoporphyrin IX monomethyl ester cyclase